MKPTILKILHLAANPAEHARLCMLLGEVSRVRYEVDWAQSPEEGLRLIGGNRYDACLVDYHVGSDADIDFIHDVKTSGGVTAEPLILINGEGDKTHDERAMSAGAADHLEMKSLSATLLDRAIRFALRRRRMLAELRDKQTQIKLALSAANLGFWSWDLAAGHFYLSPEFKRMLGYADSEPLFESHEAWIEAVHPDDRGYIQQAEKQLMEGTGATAATLYRLCDKTGAYRWIQTRALVLRDQHGRPIRMLGINHDVTENKLAQERLREQATVLDQANDAIVVRDLEHRYLYCNPSAARLAGTTVEAVVGRRISEVFGEVSAEYQTTVDYVLQNGSWQGELVYKRRDGSSFTVEGRWTLLRDDAGRPRAILAISADITEKKHLEAQYLRAQRMESIGLLAGGIAHDLNNVLAPIVMATQLLKLRHPDPESRQMLKTIETSAQRGAALVRQVLSFSHGMESQHMLVHPKSLIRDVEMLIANTVAKSIEVETRLEPDLWPIVGDPTQLHQVLMNLCINARDAMPRGGRLVLAARNMRIDEQYAAMDSSVAPGVYVLLEVEDTGTGIPPEIHDRIFETFFTTKEPGKGTGLGLSTVRAIVKDHRGHLEFESAVGVGTKFKLYLPASLETAIARESRPTIAPPAGRGETVLVVDDETPLLDIISRSLIDAGYRVLTAVNGAEAFTLFTRNRNRIALVVTDLVMPLLDGTSFIEALGRIDPTVRVIVISGIKPKTAWTNPAVATFLPKPFTQEMMLTAIHRVLADPTGPAFVFPGVSTGSMSPFTQPEPATAKTAG